MTSHADKVRGPPKGDAGFIRDFLIFTNALDPIRLTAGDHVKLHISCEGYAVENSVLFPQTKNDPGASSHIDNDHSREQGHEELDKSSIDSNLTVAGEETATPNSNADRLRKAVAKRFQEAKWVDIVLRPLPDTPWPTSSTILMVHGLESQVCSPFHVTLSPDDVLARFISHDKDNNLIKLRVACCEMYTYDGMDEDLIYMKDYNDLTHISSPFLQDLWDRFESAPVQEGVHFADGVVPSDLSELLTCQIDELAAKEPVDYHPGSKDCVRDLVHPSLYPYVRNESPVMCDAQPVLRAIAEYNRSVAEGDGSDRWGRPFEASKYQWLPTVFEIDPKGRVSIDGYINNLDRDKYSGLYDSLARLFEIFLPRMQEVYAYAQQLKFLPKDDDYTDLFDLENEHDPDFAAAKLSDKPVRVITKIVDYELRGDDEAIDGVFHVEGMSSDHVILTGVYVLRRDEDFTGGELAFRRNFLCFEGMQIHREVTQCRHWRSDGIVDENMVPLGKLETPQGRLIVFPNSHIHCLSRMARDAACKSTKGRAAVSRRRVVVFWIVDPEREVMTTQMVPRQQGVMLEERAKEHRLALMEERRMMKGKLNGERKVHLCEH